MGGAYTLQGSAGDFSVGSGVGSMTVHTPASGHGATLLATSVLNTDEVVDTGTSLAPAGGSWGQVSYLTARRTANNTEYRVRLRFPPTGGVRLSFVKVVGNTTEVAIGSEVTLPLSYVAGQLYSLRFDVTGTNPTTLQAKVWVAGTTEPGAWDLTATDGQAQLQAAGSPGVRGFLGGGASNVPAFLFDNLTVTDLNGAPPSNVPPVARFTASCGGQLCSFDGSASSDSDGTVVGYAWDFGDGTTGSGATLNHTYTAGGTYTVVLTVTDNDGATGNVSHSVNPQSSNGAAALDTFARTVASGWGSADVGGAYTLQGSAGDFSVGSGVGSMTVHTPASGHGATLLATSVLNTDEVVDTGTSLAPAGGSWGQVSYLTARRTANNTEYRVRLRFPPTGGVRLSFVKVVGNTTEGRDRLRGDAAAVVCGGSVVFVAFRCDGYEPHHVAGEGLGRRVRPSPAALDVTATDGQAQLQAAGSPGVRGFLGSGASNVPAFLFDNLTVTDLNGAPAEQRAAGGAVTASCGGQLCSFDGSVVGFRRHGGRLCVGLR